MLEKIRKAIQLFAAHWKLFSLIVLTVWLPGSIVLAYLSLYVFPKMTGGNEVRMFFQEMRVENALETVFGPFYVGALLHALSQIKRGLPVNYSQSMAHAARRSFKFLVTRLVTRLIILAGFLAFIIPGIVLALRFALIDAVVTLEGVEDSQARSLSARMTKGKRWQILGTMILTNVGLLVLIAVTFFLLSLPLSLIGQEQNFTLEVIAGCISSVFSAIPIIVLFLFYWDAKTEQVVERK